MPYRDLDRPPLDAAALRHALVAPGTWWRDVRVTAQTGSTNADATALARADAPEGTLVTTDHQTSGRGRLGRSWEAPPSSGIALSAIVRPDHVPPARWSWLPLLVGLAVVETVREAAGVEASLKWPNDVLVGERKLAGILLERIETPSGAAAVVGVGLNVSLRADELPVPGATSLAIEGATTTDRSVLVRALARTFEALYRAWAASDGDPSGGIHDSYLRRCVTIGQLVRVEFADGPDLVGTATAIDSAGRLSVSTGREQRVLSAGDITHLRPIS